MAIDRRHKKTEIAIQNAFVKLILEEGYESLKIQDLIEEANVNKSTFYLHYYSLLGVGYALEDQLISELLNVWNATAKNIEERLKSLLALLSKEKKRFIAIFSIGDGHFYKKAEAVFSPLINFENSNKENRIFYQSFVFGGIYGVLRQFVLSSTRIDKEKFVSDILKIVENTTKKVD